MCAKNVSNTHKLTMFGLKKLASGVFPESWKVVAEWCWRWQRRRRWQRQRKRTKNNKSPSYPGWLKYVYVCLMCACRHKCLITTGNLFIVHFFCKARADDLEDMGQYQKLFLYITHVLLVGNICTKYEKDPSSGRKVTVWTSFRLPTDGWTDRQTDGRTDGGKKWN